MRQTTHIIYDLDGLLLDTEYLFERFIKEFASLHGQPYPAEARRKMFGHKPIESAQILVEALGINIDPQDYLDWRDGRLYEQFPSVKAMPGAKDLVEHFAQHDVSQSIATGSVRAAFDLKITKHHDWIDACTVVITSDDARIKHGKPAPDIYQVIAEELDADPASCLVFEDADNGVIAAKAAGMSVVAVPNPEIDRTLFKQADLIVETLSDFDPEPWGLPSK